MKQDATSLYFSYYPMQQDMNFPKLFLRTISEIDYQKLKGGFVTRVTEYTVFVTNTVTFFFPRIYGLLIMPQYFGLKEK